MLNRPTSGTPSPGSLPMLLNFFYSLAPYLSILPFVLIITKTSQQMAMRKSIHGVVDVHSLGFRHQVSMLHKIFQIRAAVHAVLTNSHTVLSIRHAAPNNY